MMIGGDHSRRHQFVPSVVVSGDGALESSQYCCGGPPPSKRPKQSIAQEIIAYNILPRLPFKSLRRFSSVCKTWNRLFSSDDHDPLFTNLRCCIITGRRIGPGAATVSLNRRGDIHFFPTAATSPADIPPPLLASSFLAPADDTDMVGVVSIEASTGGLLCLLCGSRSQGPFLYVCNPATKEPGHRIPLPPKFYPHESIGLALVNSAPPYTLVHPSREGTLYRFKVFSSSSSRSSTTQGWTDSDQTCTVGAVKWPTEKSVFARGCLYWYCTEYLLWFPCRDKPLAAAAAAGAGHTLMPSWPLWKPHSRQELGVCEEDVVTLTQLSATRLSVWVLREEDNPDNGIHKYWEQIYGASMESILEPNGHVFSNFISSSDLLASIYQLWPLSFEGGSKVLLRLVPNDFSDEPDAAVLSFDMRSMKITEICRGAVFESYRCFGYIKTADENFEDANQNMEGTGFIDLGNILIEKLKKHLNAILDIYRGLKHKNLSKWHARPDTT